MTEKEEKKQMIQQAREERKREREIQQQNYIQQQREFYKKDLEEGTIPENWKKWNWSIFFFSWSWALFYLVSAYKVLLIFIAIGLNFVTGLFAELGLFWLGLGIEIAYRIFLALHGHSWAFQSDCWKREDTYWNAQGKWIFIGGILFGIYVICLLIAYIGIWYQYRVMW